MESPYAKNAPDTTSDMSAPTTSDTTVSNSTSAVDFGFQEMQAIQRQLFEKYKDKWPPLSPDEGKDTLLWLMVELGEAADILKKQGPQKVMEDTEVRRHFIEELTDVMMFFNDALLCYDISVEELKTIYLEKHQRNMNRW